MSEFSTEKPEQNLNDPNALTRTSSSGIDNPGYNGNTVGTGASSEAGSGNASETVTDETVTDADVASISSAELTNGDDNEDADLGPGSES